MGEGGSGVARWRHAGPELLGGISSVYEQALGRLLVTSERVGSAAEGRALLTSDEGAEAVADRLQRLIVFTVPILRMAARGAKFTRLPWVLLGSTSVSTGLTVHTGVRELQAVSALLAHRIEATTGQPADPALVTKLTVELYLRPKRPPDLSDRHARPRRLLRRWLFRGVAGRDTGKAAIKALDAAERLDLRPLIARWSELGPP